MALICVPITGPTNKDIEELLVRASACADMIEWRLDLFDEMILEKLGRWIQTSALPSLFTLRTKSHGGNFTSTEEERLSLLKQLLELEPDYIDLECDTSVDFLNDVFKNYPKTRLILSYHDFKGTPDDLESIFLHMKQQPAHLYKIATMAHSTLDGMRMLKLVQKYSGQLIGIAMGESSEFTRIAGAIYGSPITYASINDEQKTAPGQIVTDDLIKIYNYKQLTSETRLFGLIGDPVDKSIGHLVHNEVFRNEGLDALYVKMKVTKDELEAFLAFAKELHFSGLSVTMPLKEAILPFLDLLDNNADQIKAVNTVCFKEDRAIGYNTDSKGALDAIEAHGPIKDKKVVILGAGGAARAVAYEAIRRGAFVVIVNRNTERAREMAECFGCSYGLLEEHLDYDIIINATPEDMPIDASVIIPKTIAMELKTVPRMTSFLQVAHEKGCTLVYGSDMFYKQAAGQFELWFKTTYFVFDVNLIDRGVVSLRKADRVSLIRN